ncbi:uncharacterized protein LOC105274919 isoform X2 [Ooceraea biroi]|nr:uncharacterized protein LOC105274919 isoform X2 [Ooceraea biroi]EZA59881.1 hypothetical protein X777_16083 [Ooceraea biroi]
MPIFPEISWKRVRSKLVKNHQNFNVANAARVIEETLNSINLGEKDLRDRLGMLEVTDVSRHDKRKIWYCYELTGLGRQVNYLGRREIEDNIREEFHSSSINAGVKAAMHDDIMFVSVKERPKRKRVQHTTPVFFALFLGRKHFFCSKKNVSLEFVKAISITMGYTNSKRIMLTGRNLRSLIRLLWIKQQGVLCAKNISQPTVYKPSDPVITNFGIDYTQSKQRKNYIEHCFGKDPPTFELLVIKAPNESIEHKELASKLPTDSIRMSWEFRSHNIPRFLSSLVEKRVFVLPLPEYVSNLMTLGKNELKLQTG